MNLDLSAIAERLPHERWFGDKSRTISDISLIDRAALEDGEPILALVILEVAFTEGGPALYHLPLLVEPDGSSRDATSEPQRLAVLGDYLARPHPLQGDNGAFHFSGPGLDPTAPPGHRSIRSLGAEQSNTSIVMDEHVILKFFRKVSRGPNPELELTRLLTNEGFPHIPSQVAEITYEGEDPDEPLEIDLATAQTFVEGGTEGWSFILGELARLYDEIHEADVSEDRLVLTEDRSEASLDAIEQLGEVTALLHVTLSRQELDHELLPETADDLDLKNWVQSANEMLRHATAAPEIAELAPQIEERLERVLTLDDAGWKTRVHGDYHLGQVLLAARRWLILDFEGEPARTLEERRTKHSPLKDVAGMLRSLNYAAYASLFDRAAPGDDEWKRLEPWADTWEVLARERFLNAYFTRSLEGTFLPEDRSNLPPLLDLFELDKALYEVVYEMNARPEWLRIPIKGVTQILARTVEA